MPPIPIALCITDLDVGGAEKNLVEVAIRLDRERFAPRVYCLASRPTPPGDCLVERLERAGVPIRFLDARRLWGVVPLVRRLERFFAEDRPQLVQSFLFHANVAARVAARRAGVPRVVAGVRVAQRRGTWHLWVDWATSQLVDRYVCVSESVARFTRDRGGIPGERIVVIPNGIDPAPYPGKPANLAPLGVPPGARPAVFLGRLHRQKGLDWFLSAVQGVLRDRPDAHLLLVGDGPEERRLQRLVDRLALAGQVHFAHWQADVPGILAASSLLVLPSRWEGMPNVLLEAMATGLPVVASDVEGVREILGPLAPEQVVAFGDTAALARQVAFFLDDPQRRQEWGSRNRRRVETDASWEPMVRAYESLWASLL